jgi:DNA-binding transcriptional ArsR family regulator
MSKAERYAKETLSHAYMGKDILNVISFIYRPLNLQIIDLLLKEKYLPVTEVMIQLRTSHSQASSYLSALEKIGILSKLRIGQFVYYQVTDMYHVIANHTKEYKTLINPVKLGKNYSMIYEAQEC